MNAQRVAKANPAAPAARFIDNGDGTVTDTTTGLMWSGTLECGRVEHADAAKACSGLTLAGNTDWRLPTIEELFLLADRTRSDPAIDTAFFPDTKSSWYWSSTPWEPDASSCAWLVNFDYGYASSCSRSYKAFVRAVRVAPAGQ